MRRPLRRLSLIAAVLLLSVLMRPQAARAVAVWAPGASAMVSHGPSAVLLNDGRVLAIGGPNIGATEVYDPAADRWTSAGEIENGNGYATLLSDGTVLVSGGTPHLGPHGIFGTAWRYNSATNSWAPAAPLLRPRAGHTATLLPDGRVLVAGGFSAIEASPISTNTAELYDPVTNTWAPAAPMHAPRFGHTATRLATGAILVVGGDASGAAAELYDPAANSWTEVAPMSRARPFHTATWLPNNTVLVTSDGSAEIYDPAGNSWRPTPPMITQRTRASYSATLLPSGQVLIAGGSFMPDNDLYILAATELYDWRIDHWIPGAPLGTGRENHAAVVLRSGQLLVTGGYGDGGHGPLIGGANGVDLTSTERYDEPDTPQRCFAETGQCVRGIFLRYWDAHGGLAINGYPISGEIVEVLENGTAYTVQYFERSRLEYHAENQPPYDVLLGQFGRRVHPADPPAPRLSGATYFAETGHNLSGSFLRYWQRKGGLAQFGYPISEEFPETLEDGQTYTVQYFERARFEHHPENQSPYDVLLGQLGRRVYNQR